MLSEQRPGTPLNRPKNASSILIQIKAVFFSSVILTQRLEQEDIKMSEGETLYLGLVIGGFVFFALVMGYVNLRQK